MRKIFHKGKIQKQKQKQTYTPAELKLKFFDVCIKWVCLGVSLTLLSYVTYIKVVLAISNYRKISHCKGTGRDYTYAH